MRRSGVVKLLKRCVILVFVVMLTLLGLRIYDTQRGPPVSLWHTFVPADLHADEIEASDWKHYVAAENTLFASVRAEVTDKLPPEDRVSSNRYFSGSPLYPGTFSHDWNRSYELVPEGEPVGAVVLLHGLTDAPFSLRHIANIYRSHGYLAVGIRFPGHGTVPAALTDVEWADWMAATRLAVREARGRIGPSKPLHIVGFSNGGALAVKYALDAIEDPRLPRITHLTLVSPMIGITAFARFAGLAALPALLPRFAKAAWLGIVPEFNPFKYNSFPVNGARQSHRLTIVLQQQIQRHARAGDLDRLPPILTFQSVFDFTVSTRAILSALYAPLPANGSEIVLFDLNRNFKIGPMLNPAAETVLDRILPAGPRAFRTTIITNARPDTYQVVERVTEAGESAQADHALPLTYPSTLYSLSHVALPFPTSDGLYGMDPDPSEDFGVRLGALAVRGERGLLVITLDALIRASSNPFFPYLQERIEETISAPPPGTQSSVPH
jgi:alpha-beta hydrolase superfamily lysophospholipase